MTKMDNQWLEDFLDAVGDVSSEGVLLTIEQVATQMGVTPQTVRNWEKSGKLVPADKTDKGHRRYTQDQVTALKRTESKFELVIEIKASDLLSRIQNAMANFSPDETVTVNIIKNEFNRKVYFIIDSEDGLNQFRHALKIED